MLPSLGRLTVQSPNAPKRVLIGNIDTTSGEDDLESMEVATVNESNVFQCTNVEKIEVFKMKPLLLRNSGASAGGVLQMPSMTLTEQECHIKCQGEKKVHLKIATLKTELVYNEPQFLFHAGVDDHIKDDGHFRYFAFDVTHAANYADEEVFRRKKPSKFLHVFKIIKPIPRLAFFADSKTWNEMSGRVKMVKRNQCLPPQGELLTDNQKKEAQKDAVGLGMPQIEYDWVNQINSFETCKNEKLNGFISTTVASQTVPVLIVEPKFELMLKVERLSTYLQHVKCFELVDYNGTVTYEEANNKRVRGDDYPNPNPNPNSNPAARSG